MPNETERMSDATLDGLLRLSRLDIEAADRAALKDQAGRIIAYFDLLKGYEASAAEADRDAAVGPEALRPDSAEPGLEVRDVKLFAASWLDGYFGVPKIIEGEE